MAEKNIIIWASIISGLVSLVLSLIAFIVFRITKGYDGQIKELFERTKDLPAIREAVKWLEREINKK